MNKESNEQKFYPLFPGLPSGGKVVYLSLSRPPLQQPQSNMQALGFKGQGGKALISKHVSEKSRLK